MLIDNGQSSSVPSQQPSTPKLVETIVKFISNDDTNSRNAIITKTLGKFGVFHQRLLDDLEDPPQPREFWRVEILKEVVKEKENGAVGGCFVLRPLRRIGQRKIDGAAVPDIEYVLPGAYDSVRYENSLIILPKLEGYNWICGLKIKQHLFDQYRVDDGADRPTFKINSFIVSLNGATSWKVERHALAPSRRPITVQVSESAATDTDRSTCQIEDASGNIYSRR